VKRDQQGEPRLLPGRITLGVKNGMWRTCTRGILLALAMTSAGAAGMACDVNVAGGNLNLGLAAGKATDEWTRSYTLASGGRVEVTNINGSVTVEPSGNAQKVEVKAERLAKASSDEAARELLKQIEIHEEIAPDSVKIETRAPKTRGRSGHEVKYVVRVPASAVVTARTTNGGVQLARLPNDVVARAQNGGVKGDDLSGHVDASTTNGGVDMSFSALPASGEVSLETTNGGVAITLPRTANADISARVVNGGMRVSDDLPLTITGERSRRRLQGRLNSGGSRVELATTNGGIHISGR
jgi:DUF4097 and DUF4098 domain-containing protein YvlB